LYKNDIEEIEESTIERNDPLWGGWNETKPVVQETVDVDMRGYKFEPINLDDSFMIFNPVNGSLLL